MLLLTRCKSVSGVVVVTPGKASFRESLEQEEVRQMLYADRQNDAGESGSGHLAV